MKPFNLEEALAGKPVVTRDGHNVSQITHFKNVDTPLSVRAVIQNNVTSFTEEGNYYQSRDPNSYDLFMKSEKKKLYIGIATKPFDSVLSPSHHATNAYEDKERLLNLLEFQGDYRIVEIELDV